MSCLTKLSRSSLIAFAACSTILAVIPNKPALAQPTSPSSYQNSCQSIKYARQNLIQATCRTENGSSKSTLIRIRGIDNQNGNLRYSSNPNAAATYFRSCSAIRVNRTTLSANCSQINGSSKSTSILIRGIDNQNGTLTYSQ